MATKDTQQSAPADVATVPQQVADQPSEGGSYTLDDKTGARVLVHRTEPNNPARSKP